MLRPENAPTAKIRLTWGMGMFYFAFYKIKRVEERKTQHTIETQPYVKPGQSTILISLLQPVSSIIVVDFIEALVKTDFWPLAKQAIWQSFTHPSLVR